jgi:hypothetical protein
MTPGPVYGDIHPYPTQLDASACSFSCDNETRVLPGSKVSVSLDFMCDDLTKFTHYVRPSRIRYLTL